MHPYQLAATLRARGVPVNRGSLYDTVAAMARAGWIEPLEAERDGARPERTPYALTDVGRAELVHRLDAQVRTPRREFPEFFGAVSHVGVLGPERAADALRARAQRLTGMITEDAERLHEALGGEKVPRLFVVEAEYALAMLQAERDWVLAVIEDIHTGRLRWPRGRERNDDA